VTDRSHSQAGWLRGPSQLERALVRAAVGACSRSGRNASLLVLIYHRVLAEPDPLLPDEPVAAKFAAEMDLLGASLTPLPLADAVDRLRAGTLPRRAVCVTFDDGYANNCEVAQPILASRGIPATVFVAPGFLDGGRMFNDTVIETVRRAPARLDLRPLDLGVHDLPDPAARRRLIDELLRQLKYHPLVERHRRIEAIVQIAGVRLPDDLMMTRDQVRKLHRCGIEIGAHTMDHPILASIDDDEARSQIERSKAVLEQIVGAPVLTFAYPNGKPRRDFDARHVAMARQAGFKCAVTTAWGAAGGACDPFQVPRVAAWDRSPLRYGLRLARAARQLSPETV
jgi:peptidoglycan/xylan/chitin deacetylase (PgdA/CDA1 family)